MLDYLNLPEDLQKLIEKRESPERRVIARRNPQSSRANRSPSKADLRKNRERRQTRRRKADRKKPSARRNHSQ